MKLYGVFIGIDSYRDPRIGNLQYAANDAKQFHRIVTERIVENKTWLFTNFDATKSNIEHTIGTDLASQAKKEDMVILYFSGHGSPETTPDIDRLSRYLILHDTEYERIFATGLDLERDVPRLLERIRARLILVFIDSCFSGRAGGRTFEGPLLSDSGLILRTPQVSLNELDLGEGRVIISACDDNEVAKEDSRLGHGVFTYQLLRTLTDGRHGQQSLGVGYLYETVKDKVKEYTNNQQSPILNGRLNDAHLPIIP